ncbi:hypothetical protein MKY84_04960 [Chryseomicrobium sp. FSL W7-1435]|uniref:hypothetical protein n=1 Tax=Chryseomicrobium sp. FSL W7-1435 TaxID=2921704 RepID=UPI00315A9E54
MKSDQVSEQDGDQASDYTNEEKEGHLAGLTPLQLALPDKPTSQYQKYYLKKSLI